VDEIMPVKTDDAKAMARRLAREETPLCGDVGPGAKVVTLMTDSGLKYLSTDVYRLP
jgi:cysteine synthase A